MSISRRLRTTITGSAIGLSLSLSASPALSDSQAILEGERFHPEVSTRGMVATSHFLASEVARDVLANGGNAVDAAVTAGFALAVTQPRSGNIGGGGFMLISDETSGDVIAIDYREKAPKAAYETMFQDDSGDAVAELSRYTHNAAGVPGTVAGLALALEQYGTMTLAETLAPAIKLAEDGFAVPQRFVDGIESASERFEPWEASRAKFFKEDGS
ncbi:MAG: gamma-glutamyltransferase, partial [Pseudomonadota bacterium]|nr:gamma-glutamyltransferase [Pseudomonadota bacterium]